eukprot:gb/GECG01000456.1/.p1 GENE.gb/GECG01000456.1/~~gb/GECG01000456.1/.p1  ORF type:complete len:241 (+),score=55.39 gb/GECG01000456.1/:1-723(+)
MGNQAAKPTLEEQIRENKKQIRRGIREIDRERTRMERQKKQLEQDMRRYAKEGQTGPVRVMAKDYVRTKNNIDKFYNMRSQLQGVQTQIQTMSSTEAMSRAMQGATQAMIRMSKQMNMPQLQNVIRQFQMNSEKMEMGQEMMGDAIDDVMEEEGDEEEQEEMVSQVLSELNISTMQEAPSAPEGSASKQPQGKEERKQVPMAEGQGAAASSGDNTGSSQDAPSADPAMSDLEQRLKNLRK